VLEKAGDKGFDRRQDNTCIFTPERGCDKQATLLYFPSLKSREKKRL